MHVTCTFYKLQALFIMYILINDVYLGSVLLSIVSTGFYATLALLTTIEVYPQEIFNKLSVMSILVNKSRYW